ncbi:MAG TPA: DUF1289 domain-containing protein [Rhodocyclaceae bacterium]|nr:DUF1289 domain-containing protein [Rhodocyclaceae bacterium]
MSIASPCINVCRMNAATGLCEGCFRSLDEIARWSAYDDEAKRRVLAAVERRRAADSGGTAQVAVGGGRR